MPLLPDIDNDSYNQYQADQFGQQTDRRIGALGFSTAADTRISSLNDFAASTPSPTAPPARDDWATAQPQPAPAESAAPVVQPEPAPTETAPSAISSYPAPDAPVTAPLVRPPAMTASPPSSAQSGGQDLVAEALNAADRVGIDGPLFVSQLQQESGLRHYRADGGIVTSPAGARGVGQLMPDTARGLGVNPDDPIQNLQGAAQYFKQQLDRFGGDVVKALAAYNAGAGTVDKYGGVPPYEETQKYVDNILGRLSAESTTNPAGGYAPGPTEALPRVGAAIQSRDSASFGGASSGQPWQGGARRGTEDISQFGNSELTSDEAYAACGPAAAVRFAQRFGRNPTLREALDLAKTVGWTSAQGMAGLSSEQALMDKMQIPTKLVSGPAWDMFAKEAQTGNPVTISTAGHYFTADGYDPNSGRFHVGRSGLDLKSGKEWMTPAEMTNLMGAVQGGLLADNPQVPAPSTADQETNPVGWLDRAKSAISSTWDTATSALGSALDAGGINLTDPTRSVIGNTPIPPAGTVPTRPELAQTALESPAVQDVAANGPIGVTRGALQSATSAVGEDIAALGQTGAGQWKAEHFPSVLDPAHSANVMRDLEAKYGTSTPNDQMTPKDRQRAEGLALMVGGVTGSGGSSRYFHGTGSDFARPDAAKFDPDGLFGPGYYLTSDARVAGGVAREGEAVASGYAQSRAVRGVGANVRAVDVPGDLNLLNADAPPPLEVKQVLQAAFDRAYPNHQPGIGPATIANDSTMADLYQYSERSGFGSREMFNKALADAGYDGIQYSGGQRVPLRDSAGVPIEHTAINVFPSSIDKLRNAVSGTQGGQIDPRFATTLGGAAAGGGTAAVTTDPNDPNYWAKVAGGAAIGAGVGYGGARALSSPAVREFATSEEGALKWPGGRNTVSQKAAVNPIPERPLPEGARPIMLTPAEEATRLRPQDFPADVRQTIIDNAQAIDWARTQRRGVIPDDVAQQMAEQYAADHSLDQMIRQGAAGKAYTTEQIRALRNATAAQAVSVNDAAAAIAKGDDSSTALQAFFTEGEKLQRLVQISEGAKAEAGRSLRAYQDPAQLINLSPSDAVAKITREIGGDREKLLNAVQQYQQLVDSGAGPVQIAKFWSALKNPVGPGDWFRLVRYNSMLSGPRSLEINVVGNALELPWRLARDTAASVVRGRPGEVGVEMNGMLGGLAQANQHFMETLMQGITTQAAFRGEIPQSLSARLTNPVAKGVATTLEVPGRLMGAADAWAQTIAYNMALGREAAVQASREGLRGDTWTTRVSQIMSDPATVPALMQRADGVAQRMTYHGDMGNVGQGLQAFTQKAGIVGNLILPFLRTVYHITARGIDRSPVGLVGTGIDVARGAYGPRTAANLGEALAGRSVMPKGVAPLGERLGDNLMGSAVFTGVLLKALDGDVSAAGPDDPSRRQLLTSEGWQPYSVHIGDKWVSYANWGPAAIPFALAGAAAEAHRYAKPGADIGPLVLDGMRRTAQVVQQQTYLQSIGAAWQGMNDPQRYGFQWVNNTIGSLIPYGAAINTLGQATDEVARRPDKFDIGDAIRARLPENTPVIGGRETVPVSQDVLGRPNPNMRSGFGAVNPLMVSPDRADPVLKALDQAGVIVSAPPPSVTRNGAPIALTPDEQRQIQTAAGQKIAERVASEIASPSYAQLAQDGKVKRLQGIVDRARSAVADQLLNSLPTAEYQRRKTQGQTTREKVPVSGR